VLRRIFGSMGEECNKRLEKILVILVMHFIKSRRKRWTGHIIYMKEIKNVYKILTRKHK
jgi:hypothetical protein